MGWLGYCSSENCEGEEPTSIIIGFTYDATLVQFAWYITADGQADGELNESMIAFRDLYFTWIEWYSSEPAAPSTDEVNAILEAIGATGATLTVTMLYNAPVDLDLHFSCADGSMIYYG